ncbi:MAG: hypothetical protein ACI39W_03310 [Brotaphodocola sp.]
MAVRLIIDGNSVYEIDEECMECQRKKQRFQKKESPGDRCEKNSDDKWNKIPKI